MSKKISVEYDYIINCMVDVEVDDDFDINDEDNYYLIELPRDEIEIKINGEYYDCDFYGIRNVEEADEE